MDGGENKLPGRHTSESRIDFAQKNRPVRGGFSLQSELRNDLYSRVHYRCLGRREVRICPAERVPDGQSDLKGARRAEFDDWRHAGQCRTRFWRCGTGEVPSVKQVTCVTQMYGTRWQRAGNLDADAGCRASKCYRDPCCSRSWRRYDGCRLVRASQMATKSSTES